MVVEVKPVGKNQLSAASAKSLRAEHQDKFALQFEGVQKRQAPAPQARASTMDLDENGGSQSGSRSEWGYRPDGDDGLSDASSYYSSSQAPPSLIPATQEELGVESDSSSGADVVDLTSVSSGEVGSPISVKPLRKLGNSVMDGVSNAYTATRQAPVIGGILGLYEGAFHLSRIDRLAKPLVHGIAKIGNPVLDYVDGKLGDEMVYIFEKSLMPSDGSSVSGTKSKERLNFLLTGDRTNLQSELSAYLGQLEQENRRLREELQDGKKHQSTDRVQLAALQKELEVIDSTAIELEGKLYGVTMQRDELDKELQSLRIEYQEVEEELKKHETENEALHSRLEELEKEMTEKLTEIEALEREQDEQDVLVEKLQNESEGLKDRIIALETENERLGQLLQEGDSLRTSQKQTLAGQEEKIANLNKQVAILQKEVTRLEAEKGRVEIQLTEVEGYMRSEAGKTLQRLETELAETKMKLADSEQLIDELEEEKANLEAEVEDLKAELEEAEEEEDETPAPPSRHVQTKNPSTAAAPVPAKAKK